MIPLSEKHLRGILCEWVPHYNHARPHRSLGPGLPVPIAKPKVAGQTVCHDFPQDYRVMRKSVLGGLHHEYSFERAA